MNDPFGSVDWRGNHGGGGGGATNLVNGVKELTLHDDSINAAATPTVATFDAIPARVRFRPIVEHSASFSVHPADEDVTLGSSLL